MKKRINLWLIIGFLAAFNSNADQVILDDLILAGTSDGTVPAYDCSAPTLQFFPLDPSQSVGLIPAGDPIVIPAPIIASCVGTVCEFTCAPVTANACVGFDCVNGESFNNHSLKLKENNTRIRFTDLTVNDQLGQSWNVAANASANHGAHYLSIEVKSTVDTDLIFSDGTAPLYDCSGAGVPNETLPFLFAAVPDQSAIVGVTPFGAAVLLPAPETNTCLIDPVLPDVYNCDFTCPQLTGFTEKPALLLGTDTGNPSFTNGVALGIHSAAEDNMISLGRAGLLRQLRHVATAMANNDALTVEGLNLNLLEQALIYYNTLLDGIEVKIEQLEAGGASPNPYDVNGDNVVDMNDFMAVRACFRKNIATNPSCASADVNGDGVINTLDFSLVLSNRTP
ncbi:MAG: hypothetical protein HRU23_07415 [Gammaproteobacteria bacterium]|nr:hypothetical protein [Gammaproteobacteria bacterium]